MDADLLSRAESAAAIAREHADTVDRNSRFPHEALAALREQRLLGLMVKPEDGGEGRSYREIGQVTELLAAACGSTGMVYAMHQNQIAGLVRHADTAYFAARRRDAVDRQLLIASATTEIGIGGDLRSSTCAVEPGADGRFTLVKNAPVISYADDSDVIVVTARRSPEAGPADQVLVYCDREHVELDKTIPWNVMGFRGTCSPGYLLRTENSTEAIFPEPFADMLARCMLPGAHIFWASVWLGIATEAVGKARSFVQNAARKNPGSMPPGAPRLAELQITLQTFGSTVHHGADRLDELAPDDPELSSVPFALAMNGLKVYASTTVVDIVSRAMLITGIAGYRLDSPYTLDRHLRDAFGAAIMVNNDRILGNSSQLELVNRRGGAW